MCFLHLFYLNPFTFWISWAALLTHVEYHLGDESLEEGANYSPLPDLGCPVKVSFQIP
jgi:hypothetical protein